MKTIYLTMLLIVSSVGVAKANAADERMNVLFWLPTI